jgi:Transcriptional regulator
MRKDVITQDVRGKILQTARELFVQKGFDGVSIRDIASASETNIAMVNYYFRSKHNLFAEIFGEVFKIVGGKVFSLMKSDLPFFDMIREWVYAYYDMLDEYSAMPSFIFSELSRHPNMLEEKINKEIPLELFETVSQRLKEEAEKGTIRPVDPVHFGLSVISLCIFPFVFTPVAYNLVGLEKESYKEFLQEHKKFVADFIINSIKISD